MHLCGPRHEPVGSWAVSPAVSRAPIDMTVTAPAIEDQAKSALREKIRELRQRLSDTEQRHASNNLCRRIATSDLFTRARRIAFYMPMDGEISTLPLLELAQTRGKLCLLPVVDGNHLIFREFNGKLQKNRFGIPEPVNSYTYAPWVIDLVLMPMVAFDREHNRLGMGGGYYDRTFSFVRDGPSRPRTPTLLGVAHALQGVHRVPTAAHDLRPDHIVTDIAWH